MGRPGDERITNDVAREICQRQGIKAMLTGTIASLGDHYVVTLAALNGSTGDSLAREQVEVDRKEQVLKALDKAASQLRQKMGESLASVQQFAKPLDQATTSSLEALQAFSLGNDEHQKMQEDAAIPNLKKAVELDPNFAMAWATLGVISNNMGHAAEGVQAIRKAYDLRDRASEREKLYIQAHYYTEVTIDPEKALQVYAEWRQTYPRDTVPYVNGALAYSEMGQPEQALDLASQAHRISPRDPYAYDNMAAAYEALNRFDEAKTIAEQAEAEKADGIAVHFVLTDLAYMRGDRAGYERELNLAKGTSNEPFLLLFNAAWQGAEGKVRASRELWLRANQVSMNMGAKDLAADFLALEGYTDALYGYPDEARQKVAQVQALSSDPDARAQSAGVLAMIGDVQKSAALIAGVEHEFPENHSFSRFPSPKPRRLYSTRRTNYPRRSPPWKRRVPRNLVPGRAAEELLRFICAASSTLKCAMARKLPPNFNAFSIIAAPPALHRNIPWPVSTSAALLCCKGTRQKRRRPIRISSQHGKMPTPMFQFSRQPRRSTKS
jgi:tetratricopeptide (TPR) repeat protein